MFYVIINNDITYSVLSEVPVWSCITVCYIQIIYHLFRSSLPDSPEEPACITRPCSELSPCVCNLLWPCISLVGNISFSSDPYDLLSSLKWYSSSPSHICSDTDDKAFFISCSSLPRAVFSCHLSSFEITENLGLYLMTFMSLYNMFTACFKGIVTDTGELWAGKTRGTPIHATIFWSLPPSV